jgi:hypothetical protein
MGNEDKPPCSDIISAASLGNFNEFKKSLFEAKKSIAEEIARRLIPLGNLGVKRGWRGCRGCSLRDKKRGKSSAERHAMSYSNNCGGKLKG